ncbi:hypothetical protein GQ43DRAFT_112443 [Delitschia confertaspora ATCC 74209]|uniref:Uncharacterized protein n=1 Tax=Delitschia confertaspora ATCC 74209 TaxID=1513339 RepID=A0A9P4JMK6_9PLEO|nr:hypothetical protein GQ43DRAFT_112443 [Delitschia confertaspora ATCC 74209]
MRRRQTWRRRAQSTTPCSAVQHELCTEGRCRDTRSTYFYLTVLIPYACISGAITVPVSIAARLSLVLSRCKQRDSVYAIVVSKCTV